MSRSLPRDLADGRSARRDPPREHLHLARLGLSAKALILALACAVLAGALYASAGQAQAPGPDLGNDNVLVLACDHATLLALKEGLTVRHCRRHGPEQITGNRAIVTVRVMIRESGPFVLTFHYQRSLWSVQTFGIERG